MGIKLLKLRYGSVEPQVVVVTAIINIKAIAKKADAIVKAGEESYPGEAMAYGLAIPELWSKAKNSDHEIWSKPIEDVLKGLALINEAGEMHDSLKHIVLSYIDCNEETLNCKFQDPIDRTALDSISDSEF